MKTLALLLIAATSGGSEEAKLVGPNPKIGDRLGHALAIDGDTLLAGSLSDDIGASADQGSASVFVRAGTVWTHQQKLKASDGAAGDEFGGAVALAGERAIVGANYADPGGIGSAGAAYVFERASTTWDETGKLEASDGGIDDRFGSAVALSGDTVLVGASLDDHGGATNAGSAYVFVRVGSAWVEQAKLLPPQPGMGEAFGLSVSIDGDTAVVGAPHAVTSGRGRTGRAHVYVRSGSTWSHQWALDPADLTTGDQFGDAVSIHGDSIAVGSHQNDHAPGSIGNIFGEGSAYVFVRTGTVWSEQVRLIAPDPTPEERFGTSLSLYADRLAIGAPGGTYNSSTGATGRAFLFERTGTLWSTPPEIVASDGVGGDTFGLGLDLGSQTAAFGSPTDNHQPGFPGSHNGQGSAYVVRFAAPPPAAYCTAGTSASGCVATVQAAGAASASATSGFVLSASNVEGAKDGLFFFGTGGRQANPWGNGTSLQCVVTPVQRGGLLTSSGTSGQCDGAFSQDLNARWCGTCPKPTQNPVPCTWMQAQLWYRDPFSTSNQTTSLSSAIEFWVEP
jgi:hypothetical protein